LVTLTAPATLQEVIDRVKRHLSLQHVRVALGNGRSWDSQVRQVALAAGAGGDLLRGGDLWLTGEMRHHEVLAANAKGISVIVTDHSNSERGFLPHLGEQLQQIFEGRISFEVSESDADPL